jgi:hypothetical protein
LVVGECGKAERRRVERKQTAVTTRISPNKWSSFEADVVDLSCRGFKAAAETLLRVGSIVSIEVPELGAVPAVVVWREPEAFGARFIQPLSLASSAWLRELDNQLNHSISRSPRPAAQQDLAAFLTMVEEAGLG